MNTTTALRPAASTLNSIAAKPLRQVGNVRELLINDQARQQLQTVAAKHMNPERMMRVVANAMRTTPQLAECDPMSLLGALMQCAALGLEPNTQLGHAYLIPFKNNRKGITEVQLIIGYKGFMDLARRTGDIRNIHADVVYSDDELWSYEYGTDRHLRHKPGPRKGQKTHAYCYIALPDGDAFVVIPWEVVERTREDSQGWKTAVRFGKTADSPWKKHEDAMARKTAVRALANGGEMPLSIEFMEAMETDDRSANFASFAANPQDGLTIEAAADESGERVDQETGEVTRIEDRRGTEQTIEQQREPERAELLLEEPAKRQTRTAKPKQEEAQALALEGETVQPADPEIVVLVERVREWALNDMHDGASAESTIAAYESQLGIIKKSDAKAHDALVAEILAAKQQG